MVEAPARVKKRAYIHVLYLEAMKHGSQLQVGTYCTEIKETAPVFSVRGTGKQFQVTLASRIP